MKKSSLPMFLLLIGACCLIGISQIKKSTLPIKNEAIAPSKLEKKKARMMAKFAQEIEMTKDPALGYVPYDRLIKAQDYTKQLIQQQKKKRAAISGVNWQNMGPDNVGGRTRAIMFDPNDGTNKRVFAGGVSGGLWKNEDITDANSAWTKINDFLDNLTITSLAYDPQNTMTFYAGTGEAYSSVTPGMGVFKSTDGGATWSQLANTTDYKYVTEVLVRNESMTSVIYVASKEKYVGIDGPTNTFFGQDGLFRSDDNGANWSQVLPQNSNSRIPGVDDIGLDASNNLWVATGVNSYNDTGGDIFRCIDGTCDVAGDFTKKYNAIDSTYTTVQRTVLALAPDNANYVYAVAANNSGKMDIEFLIKSEDAGSKWTNKTIPLNTEPSEGCIVKADQHFTNGQGTYDLCLTVHPTDEDLVLIGGIDVYRTLDGFNNTSHIGSWVADDNVPTDCDKVIHADHHIFVYRPGNNNEVVFGNDGGVYYSTNTGDAGNASPDFGHRVKDYNVSQLYAADISPTKGAGEYLGGLQDNGTQDWDAGAMSTTEANGGDGAFCHIDQNEHNIQISSYIYNNYAVTVDEWAVPFGFSQVSPTPSSGRFINPTDYDDTNNVLYGASGNDRICRVLDIGNTNALTDSILVGGDGLGGAMASTFRVDRNTSTTLYVGSSAGKVVKILNANALVLTSAEIGPPVPADSYISSIDVQLGDSAHLLVTVSSYGVGHIWESVDAGANWVNVQNNFPDIPARWGIFSPANNDHALIASDLGIWSTDNINGTSTDWGMTNAGLANVRVDQLRYRTSDSTLVAATFGRGLYTYSFGGNPCPPTLVVTDNPAVGTYVALNTVSTSPGTPIQVTTNATFQAGTNIDLNNLFEVISGAVFEAKIGGCP